MTRSQTQKKLATAARTLATKIQNNKLEVKNKVFTIEGGAPANIVGQILSQAGVKFSPAKPNLYMKEALAMALNTTESVLPNAVVAAANDVYDAANRTARRDYARVLPEKLNAFANTVSQQKIRKTYTKSGLFTQAARDAGTFGKAASI